MAHSATEPPNSGEVGSTHEAETTGNMDFGAGKSYSHSEFGTFFTPDIPLYAERFRDDRAVVELVPFAALDQTDPNR